MRIGDLVLFDKGVLCISNFFIIAVLLEIEKVVH
jgi:hypothetical protein